MTMYSRPALDFAIYKAIALERERCAQIAERHAQHLELPAPLETSITFRVAQEIAALIRKDGH